MKAAMSMITDLEQRGLMHERLQLIESSSGSLGVALSLICAERGYAFTCVVDPNTSAHNIKTIKAFGAKVVMIDKRDENGGFLGSRIAYINDLVAHDANFHWLNQYANPENPGAHTRTTGPAIARRFAHVDYLFIGAGTTGTLMGCVQYFRKHHPRTQIVAVDSIGSVTFGHAPKKRYIPGLGTSRRPEIYTPEGIDHFEMVDESAAVAMCRHLARSNGLMAGGSTGTVLAAVHAWRKRLPPDALVIAISPDMGERYLDTVYDDAWVIERFGNGPLQPLASQEWPLAA
jgi:2,3-diaminopropionate biosynthesis protein SbnA